MPESILEVSYMFRVELEFKPGLEDISKHLAAVDEIFAGYNMPCVRRGGSSRAYGDNGDPKDIGTLYAAVNKIKHTPWIVKGIHDAHFDNGSTRETLMTNFFRAANL
jgi:hypothetical protein